MLFGSRRAVRAGARSRRTLNGMWLVDRFAQRKYNRRYHAALVVLLGTVLFEGLGDKDRARVEVDVDDNFNRTDTPAIATRRLLGQDLIAAHRAVAMARLDVKLPFCELSWEQLLKPWRGWKKVPEFTGRVYDSRADALVNDYRIFDSATSDARKFLSRNYIHSTETGA